MKIRCTAHKPSGVRIVVAERGASALAGASTENQEEPFWGPCFDKISRLVRVARHQLYEPFVANVGNGADRSRGKTNK